MLIEAPEGYSFEFARVMHQSDFASIHLHHGDNRFVGHICLEWVDRHNHGKGLQTHSKLLKEYHGKKLGVLMYAYAINYALLQGYSVRCSRNRSYMAKRVWMGKTLRSMFHIKPVVWWPRDEHSRLLTALWRPRLIWCAYPLTSS